VTLHPPEDVAVTGDVAGAPDATGDAGTAGGLGPAPSGRAGTRGRPPGRLLRVRGALPVAWRVGLGAAGLVALVVLWVVAARQTGSNGTGIAVPSPGQTWSALREMQSEGTLLPDTLASAKRMLWGYSISMAIGIVVGVTMGSLPGVEGTLEAPIGFLRYIPASAMTPLMLLWLGIGEAPKVTLIVLGTVFFNVLMVFDVARSVPRELIDAASTLGAGRLRSLTRVILPHSVPGIVDVARINLAAGWLMLVVAELLATDEGLAVRVARSARFRSYDTMFAVFIVFGVIGMLSDLALRGLRWAVARWDR
jgi:NitT/TauT family transport system permease protein